MKSKTFIERITVSNVFFFLVMFAILATATLYLLENNYVNDIAIGRWTKLMSVLESDELRLENLGLVYPHMPLYILVPFYYLPGLATAAAPFIMTVIVAAGWLTWWNHNLKDVGYGMLFRVGVVLLTIAHPFFLWSVTSGMTHNAISLIIFSILLMAFIQLAEEQDARAFIFLGFILALYFFIDERSIFIFITMLPLLPILAAGKILKESPVSVYIVVMFPAFVAIIAWLYLNWTFTSDPWRFLDARDSSFRGGWYNAPDIGWLVEFGGEMIRPAIVSLLMGLLSYPVIVWFWVLSKGNPIMRKCSAVLFLLPIIATALATSGYYAPHPLDFLFFYSAGVIALLGAMPKQRAGQRVTVIVLLLIGVFGGWYCMGKYPSDDMKQWVAAIRGEVPPVTHSADISLGLWLKEHRQPTLIDDRTAYRVIAARGDANGLIMSFDPKFKIELRRNRPTVELVVIPKFRSDVGGFDRVSQHFHTMYASGIAGYELVYDNLGWRVYRKVG